MMISKALAMCEILTKALGFENKSVILAWKAFEEGRYPAVSLHYNAWRIKNKNS